VDGGCDVRIGTSGWHYNHWANVFYPEKLPSGARLAHYARTFDTVEINNTFYRLPKPEAVAAWRAAVPEGFLFAVKISRFLSHMKRLRDTGLGLQRFLDATSGLGPLRGPLLLQLPPRWSPDPGRLDAFLEALPPGERCAVELRDPSWHVREVYAVLERRGAAFCSWDLQGVRSPVVLTADFTYARFHGPGTQKYVGSYSPQFLSAWARRIADWTSSLRAVHVYFDNTEGQALANARDLVRLVAARAENSEPPLRPRTASGDGRGACT
jgi:uncharacterized protein YecE (DUF72 family)